LVIRDIVVLDLACVGVRAPRGQRETIEGVATVLDGDTIEVGGVRVRLEGLHCPEARERGGSAATSAMRGLTSGQHVSCSLTGERSYDRLIGTFYVGDGATLPLAKVSGHRLRSISVMAVPAIRLCSYWRRAWRMTKKPDTRRSIEAAARRRANG
jgi:hypothetical protein